MYKDQYVDCRDCPFMEYSTLVIGKCACNADTPPYFAPLGLHEHKCRYHHFGVAIKAEASRIGLDYYRFNKILYVFEIDGIRSRFFGSFNALNTYLIDNEIRARDVFMIFIDEDEKPFYRKRIPGEFPRRKP